MSTTRRVRIPALVALVAALAGVVVAHSSAAPRAARPKVGTVVATIPIPSNSGALAVGEGAVWATSDAVPILTRIDPATNAVVARIRIASKIACIDLPGSCGEATTGDGALWIARVNDNVVLRIDPHDNSLAATIPVGPQPEGIATTPGAVWVVNKRRPQRLQDRPGDEPGRGDDPDRIRAGLLFRHMSVAAGAGAVWASLPSADSIVRIDPATNTVVARVHLSGQPCAFLAAGASRSGRRAATALVPSCASTAVRTGRPEQSRGRRPRSESPSASVRCGWPTSTRAKSCGSTRTRNGSSGGCSCEGRLYGWPSASDRCGCATTAAECCASSPTNGDLKARKRKEKS